MSQSQAEPTAKSHLRQQRFQVQLNQKQHHDWLVNQDFGHLAKHYYCQNHLRYLLGENWFVLENVLMEIPWFVFEVELLELANPFVLEGPFFISFNHDGSIVGFRKTIKAAVQPQDKN